MKKIIIILSILFTLVGCGGEASNNEKVNVTPSEVKTLSLNKYENDIFSMQIPEGWEVSYGGNAMLFGIHAYKPEQENSPKYHIFALLKAEPLYSYAFKQFEVSNFGAFPLYDILTQAPAIETPTVESFYKTFNEYTSYITKFEPTYSIQGYEMTWPVLNNFETIEQFELNSLMAPVALDDKIIRANYTDVYDGSLQQGLFSGSLTTNALGKESYTVYNIFFVSSPDEDFIEYEPLLLECMNSIKFSDAFVQNTIDASNQQTQTALAIGQSLQATYDACNKAWEERNSTYDIISQKQSDATLGYERVYNTETGEIYKAYNGFGDDYSGQLYQPITEDMYSLPIDGYIE